MEDGDGNGDDGMRGIEVQRNTIKCSDKIQNIPLTSLLQITRYINPIHLPRT